MQEVTLYMEQGATMRVTLLYTDSEDDPISLDGYRAHMQIRRRARTTSPVLANLTSENGGITLGPGEGEIHVRVKASQTAPIFRNCAYDLHLIAEDDPDEVVRVFGGPIVVTPGVTVDD